MNIRKALSLLIVWMIIWAYRYGPVHAAESSGSTSHLYKDMLSPAYYSTGNNAFFRLEVDNFLHYVGTEELWHPLKNAAGQIPAYTVVAEGIFGAGKGPTGTSEHHPAVDLHLANNATAVVMYADHEGMVATFRDAPKYRHYLTITKNIVNTEGVLVGKLVTLYAHLDLDLDEADSLFMNGQYVQPGDVVSRHLYSGTLGGPHLHFEIRYYRPSDSGTETFYGSVGADLTDASAGCWSYGYWNPDVGYGFGNPKNYGLFIDDYAEFCSFDLRLPLILK